MNKISDIFNYYLKLIFGDIKREIIKYQERLQDQKDTKPNIKNTENILETTKEYLDNYFNKQDIIIGKDELENAIRLFTTLVLFREKYKDNKIKSNRKNLIDYLKSQGLWDERENKSKKFNENLNDLKEFEVHINQTLWLYDYLVGNIQIDEFKIIEEIIKEGDEPAPKPFNADTNIQGPNDPHSSSGSESESGSGPNSDSYTDWDHSKIERIIK